MMCVIQELSGNLVLIVGRRCCNKNRVRWHNHGYGQWERGHERLITRHNLTVYEHIRLFRTGTKARFKRRILHAPNRIAELNACKMRGLNQLNATYFNSIRVSRIFDWSSRIFDWSSTVDLNAVFYMCRIRKEFKLCLIIYNCSNGNLKHVARAQQFYSAKICDAQNFRRTDFF